jgi:hypothetical protein
MRLLIKLVLGFASIALPLFSASAQNTLPGDVYPASRNRLHPVESSSSIGVEGIRTRGSSVSVRWESELGRALTELAILTVAREHDQPYEWSLHEIEALAVGLDPRVIDVVRNHKPIRGLGDKESIIIQLGREIFREHELTSATYARALYILGEENLVDIVDLMGGHVATATRLTAFNQQMPPRWAQFLPLPFTPPDVPEG